MRIIPFITRNCDEGEVKVRDEVKVKVKSGENFTSKFGWGKRLKIVLAYFDILALSRGILLIAESEIILIKCLNI